MTKSYSIKIDLNIIISINVLIDIRCQLIVGVMTFH